MKKRVLILLMAFTAALFLLPVPVFADVKNGWVQEGTAWYYYVEGQPLTGWHNDIPGWENWFYFDNDGIMAQGNKKIGDYTFRFNNDGTLYDNWVVLADNKWGYYDFSAKKLYTGWADNIPGWEGKWFYFDKETGVMTTGWAGNIPGWEGKWFYFDDNGVMATGTQVIDGYTLKFYETGDEMGLLYDAWIDLGGGKWSCYDPAVRGRCKGWFNNIPGWQGKWFYFDDDGIMAQGNKKIGDYTFRFNDDGTLQDNWVVLANDKWGYYDFNAKKLYTGWANNIPGWEGSWFYFDGNGVMATGMTSVPGLNGTCTFENNGVLRDKHMLSGILTIDTSKGTEPGCVLTASYYETGAHFTCQWYRCASAEDAGTPISGATQTTYTISADDAGKWLQCKINGTDFCSGQIASAKVDIHIHSFTYAVNSSNAAQLTATCTGETCALHTAPATLTLTAPAAEDLVYNENPIVIDFATGEAAAWKTATGSDAPAITYTATEGSTLTEGKVVNAGSYTAKATVDTDKTAALDFTVNRADYSNVTKTASGSLKYLSGSTVEITLPAIPEGTDYGAAVKANEGDPYTLSPVSGDKITAASTGIPEGTAAMTFTVSVTPDENHNGYAITVTITPTFKTAGGSTGAPIAWDTGKTVKTAEMPPEKDDEAEKVKEMKEPEQTEEEAMKHSIVMQIGNPDMKIFGESVANDVAPIIRNDRTMLPARVVAEALGANVFWNEEARKVTVQKGLLVIEILVDSDVAYVNGTEVHLDSPAFIENDRTYVPMRFLAEALGAAVAWNEENQRVIITPAENA